MSHNYLGKKLDLDSEVGVLIKATLSDGSERVVISYSYDVLPVRQNGPMCGLVGITMGVYRLETLPDDLQDGGRLHPQTILDYAIQSGLSKQGEMFSFVAMKQIIERHLFHQAKVISTGTPSNLKDLLYGVISSQTSVLIPYDADKNHSPCLAHGHRAHWCLLVGVCFTLDPLNQPKSLISGLLEFCHQRVWDSMHYYTLDPEKTQDFVKLLDPTTMSSLLGNNLLYVFARHGKSSYLGLWRLRDLLESNNNLVEVDPKRSNPLEYIIPEGGLKETLKGKALMITL